MTARAEPAAILRDAAGVYGRAALGADQLAASQDETRVSGGLGD